MVIKEALFIESYLNLCAKEATLLEEMELEERVSMEINSTMKILF